jgi:hypothetical protein
MKTMNEEEEEEEGGTNKKNIGNEIKQNILIMASHNISLVAVAIC